MEEDAPSNSDSPQGDNSPEPMVNLNEFCKHRIEEVLMLTEAVKESPFRGQAFQRLPRHMRRRQMSHHIKRLPKSIRPSSSPTLKDEVPPPPKRPSRKYRRRPRNLLLEYNRRQKSNVWMETHIWHSKRFSMISKWGYKLPERPTNKSFKACYRAATQHCFISDISYYNCLELKGPESQLLEGLQKCTSPDIGLTFAAKMFLDGSREGSVILYHPSSYPYRVIGRVSFLWRPCLEEEQLRTIWIFSHPSFYHEIVVMLKTLFELNKPEPEKHRCVTIVKKRKEESTGDKDGDKKKEKENLNQVEIEMIVDNVIELENKNEMEVDSKNKMEDEKEKESEKEKANEKANENGKEKGKGSQIHTHTHIHTHTQTHSHTQTHTHTQTHAKTVTKTTIPTQTHAKTVTKTTIPTQTHAKTVTKTTIPTQTHAKTVTKTTIPTQTHAKTVNKTPMPTQTHAKTATKTPTPTPTQTHAKTVIKTPTPTQIHAKTPTQTQTHAKTVIKTPTPTQIHAKTPTQTQTLTHAKTVTKTPTTTQIHAKTPTQTQTLTHAKTVTKTPTATQIHVKTPTPTQTHAKTPTPTQTQTHAKTPTPTQTLTHAKTPTPTQTLTHAKTVTKTTIPTQSQSQSDKDKDKEKEKKSKPEAQNKNHEEIKLRPRSIPYQRTPKYKNADGSITMSLLKDTINRFRLTGPLALSILSQTFDVNIDVEKLFPKKDNSPVPEKKEKDLKRPHSESPEATPEVAAKKMKTNLNEEVAGVSTPKKEIEFWWRSYYRNELHQKRLESQKKFYENLKNFAIPSDVPPNLVFSVIVRDPRINLPLKRLKCVPEAQKTDSSFAISIDPSICYSPMWDPAIRDNVSFKKMTTNEINEARSKLIVPGSDPRVILKDNQARVPLIIIQRTGVIPTDHFFDKSGNCSGFDVLVPAGWAMPVWLSFVFRGARAGGLREMKGLLLETNSLSDYHQPDSEGGELENLEASQAFRTLHFKYPPNNRPNFAKLGVQTPFYFPWRVIVKDWRSRTYPSEGKNSELKYYVLRDRKKLSELNTIFKNLYAMLKTQTKTPWVNIFKEEEMDCLIPVAIETKGKGSPKEHAMVCLPSVEDIRGLKTKGYTTPSEASHTDVNEGTRKLLKLEHSRLLKSLKRKRKRCKDKEIEDPDKMSVPERLDDTEEEKDEGPSSKEAIEEYSKKVECLWLEDPEGIKSVIDSCSRTIMGYVVLGNFSFTRARGIGLGYVTLRGLLFLLKRCYDGKSLPIVLYRNITSNKYRLGTLRLCTT